MTTAMTAKQQELNAAFIEAAKNGEFDEITSLLVSGADINAVEKQTGCTALILATSHRNYDLASLLLARGADVRPADKNGNTALMMGVAFCKMETVISLLHAGADIYPENKNGMTVLRCAASNAKTKVVELLLAVDADSKLTDEEKGRLVKRTNNYGWSSTAKYLESVFNGTIPRPTPAEVGLDMELREERRAVIQDKKLNPAEVVSTQSAAAAAAAAAGEELGIDTKEVGGGSGR